jgi:hypothetical protein
MSTDSNKNVDNFVDKSLVYPQMLKIDVDNSSFELLIPPTLIHIIHKTRG